jgi:hypothetical protein
VVVRFDVRRDASSSERLVNPRATQSCGPDPLRAAAVESARRSVAENEQQYLPYASGGRYELLIKFEKGIPPKPPFD